MQMNQRYSAAPVAIPLNRARPGTACFVQELRGDDELQQRLAELGFVRGACVRIVQRVSGGSAKVRVNGYNLALSGRLLEAVLVTPAGTSAAASTMPQADSVR